VPPQSQLERALYFACAVRFRVNLGKQWYNRCTMANVKDFRKGDLITFDMKGTPITARISKINRKSVKAEQTVSVSWEVQAAFGNPARTKTRGPGTPWTLGVSNTGITCFEHADPKLAAESAEDAAWDALRSAVKLAAATMSESEVRKAVDQILACR